MIREKHCKLWISWVLVFAMLLGMAAMSCACKKSGDGDDTQVEDTEKTKKTKDTGSETGDDSSDPGNGAFGKNGSGGGKNIGVTPDRLDGVWLDEHGPVLKIDTGKRKVEVIRDGWHLLLTDIDDSGITCRPDEDYSFYYYLNEESNPFFTGDTIIRFPIAMTGEGYMEFMDLPLYRGDTDEARDILKKIEEILFTTHFYGEDGELAFTPTSIEFVAEDMKESMDVKYKDGTFEMGSYFTSYSLYTYLLSNAQKDELIVGYLNAFFLSRNDILSNEIWMQNTSFVEYDGNEIETKLWSMQTPGEFTVTDISGNNSAVYPATFRVPDVVELSSSNKVLMSRPDSVCWICKDTKTGLETVLFPTWSLNGLLYLCREKVISGQAPNGIFTEDTFVYKGQNGRIEAVPDLGGKNVEDVWVPDFAAVSFSKMEDYSYYLDGIDLLSDGVRIKAGPSFSGAKITFEVSLDMDPEMIGIIDYNQPSKKYTPTSVTQNGDTVCVVFEAERDGLYFLCNGYSNDARNTFYDVETLLATDPNKTYWAMDYDTGDILELVDLEYIRSSITDMKSGAAVFWVSTPEQLASVNYYVNMLDVADGDDMTTMYYVHLLSDIDLSGYEWATMGHRNANRGTVGDETCFRGVFFGNGYSIKGLTIADPAGAFFGTVHMTTVIGLTLDHPRIGTGDASRTVDCFCNDMSCITEFFDCTVIIDPDQTGYYEFSSHENGSINFFDCHFIEAEAAGANGGSDPYAGGKEIGLDGSYTTTFYNGYDNWIRRYYAQMDGSYHYDAEREYTDFMSNSAPFIDMCYYYGGQPCQTYVGYLGFTGWLVNDEFYINYGYVYNK